MVLDITAASGRVNYGSIADKLEVGNLIRTQLDSFNWFKKEGLRELFDEINLIPNRGAWLEIETSNKDVLTVKIDRKRKVPVTTLVRALGYASNDDIRAFFAEVDIDPDHRYIDATLEKDPSTSVEEALIELY